MANTIPNIAVPPNTVINIFTDPGVVAAGVVVGDLINVKMLGYGDALFYAGATPPAKINNESGYRDLKNGQSINNVESDQGAFIYSLLGCTINVKATGVTVAPAGLYEGTRAMTTQSYNEANVKNGVQHEGSTLLTLAGSASNDTIFLTGALPVSLKGRFISYTGDGVQGDIFEAPTYTGGIDTPYQNANAINPVVGLAKILVGPAVTVDGVLKFAPAYSIGNQSNQGKGSSASVLGEERILKPNTAYLLRLTSLDTASQQVSSFLTWYEGELDLPLA